MNCKHNWINITCNRWPEPYEFDYNYYNYTLRYAVSGTCSKCGLTKAAAGHLSVDGFDKEDQINILNH